MFGLYNLALALTGWNNAASCTDDCGCAGGVSRTILAEYCRIVTVTVAPTTRVVTAITVDAVGAFFEYGHENNNTAFYDQIGSRPNGTCHEFVQTFTGEFACFTSATLEEANRLAIGRSFFAVHELENGKRIIQGIDVFEDPATPGNFLWKKSKVQAKSEIDIQSGTTSTESKVVLRITSTGAYSSAETDLTVAALLAL